MPCNASRLRWLTSSFPPEAAEFFDFMMTASPDPLTASDVFLQEAIDLALANVEEGGRPFGAIVVKYGQVIARGVNEMVETHDPTAHAEMIAIRAASQVLQSPILEGCTVYASGQPCPMCVAAMRMAGVSEVYHAFSNQDAEPYGLSTAAIAAELNIPADLESMAVLHRPAGHTGRHPYEAWLQARGVQETKRR